MSVVSMSHPGSNNAAYLRVNVLDAGEDLAEDDDVLGEVDGVPAGATGVARVEPVPECVVAKLHLQVEQRLVGHEGGTVLLCNLLDDKWRLIEAVYSVRSVWPNTGSKFGEEITGWSHGNNFWKLTML